jgi:hypothetical protein
MALQRIGPCFGAYQAIWGPDPAHPGNDRLGRGEDESGSLRVCVRGDREAPKFGLGLPKPPESRILPVRPAAAWRGGPDAERGVALKV